MKKIVFPGLFLIALVLIVFSVTAQLGWWPIRGTATPPQWEQRLGQSILSSSLSRQAKGLTNPLQPSSEVLLAGQKIFKVNCAGCHGMPSQPSQWGTHGFYPRVPQFCDRPPALSSPQMFLAIKYGIRYSGMGAWEAMMSDEEIWKVATFLEHIRSLPPEIQANWKSAQ